MTDTAQMNVPGGLCRLPQFRPVALKLLKLISSDDVEFSAVAKMLSSDPAFSAEVLALANSPLYAGSCPATSLTRAIVVLGLERTRALTLTVAMQAFMVNAHVTPELQNSWRHSVACAVLAEELAHLYGVPGDQGYTAGLMHDIGRLGLLKAYPLPYAELLARHFGSVGQTLDAERRLFQVDHCQAGVWLTHSWGFPEDFQAIAERHHSLHFGLEQGVVGLASSACLMADTLGFQSVNCRLPASFEEIACALPGPVRLDAEQLQGRIMERLEAVDLR
jgi:putative nucleotidyltransferase with HDIG domain